MKQKTIHAVVKYFYPVAAGIETNMLETYKVLVEKGWKVTVHATKNTLTESGVLSDRETVQGVHIKRYPWNRGTFTPDIPWETADIIALHNFNVFPHMTILLSVLLRKMKGQRVPVIFLTPHGGFTPDWNIFSWWVKAVKKVYHYTIGTVLINMTVDIFRTVSEWERMEVVGHGVNNKIVTTITNGIEDEAFLPIDEYASEAIKKQVKSYGKYMIQIGRIYNIKNYETVIDALARGPKDLQYVIVGPIGDIAYKAALEERIRTLGLEKRVFFAGVIRGSDKYYIIKHAQMMVHMARWESFCNAVHEGMSQGLPVIVANNTALPLLVADGVNGFCIDTFDSEKLAEKIRYIHTHANSSLVKKMRKANETFGLAHSWRSVAGMIDVLLSESKESRVVREGGKQRYAAIK